MTGAVAMPGIMDLAVVVGVQGDKNAFCQGVTQTNSSAVYLFDAVGALQGANYSHIVSPILNAPLIKSSSSPFGDPLLLTLDDYCGPQVGSSYGVSAHVFACYNLRAECGSANSYQTFPWTFVSNMSLGTLSTVVSFPLTLQPDVFALGFGASGHWIVNNSISSYACQRPCLNVTHLSQGPGLVAFQDDTYGFYTIHYDFGDGTFSNTPDPVHQYTMGGNFTVTVVATNACGSDTITIPLQPCGEVTVSTPSNGCIGAPATFTETSNYPPNTLSWIVNGAPSGTGATLVWTPPGAGTYQIGLVHTNLPCRDTVMTTFVVHSGPPTPSFSSTPSNLTVNFTNTSTNGQSYAWTFGDGGTSTTANPSHTYAAIGTYTVCLTVTNACGTQSVCQQVYAGQACNISAGANQSVCPGNAATFTATPGFASYQWSNGSTQSSISVTAATIAQQLPAPRYRCCPPRASICPTPPRSATATRT
jgi:PKD repeat protein